MARRVFIIWTHPLFHDTIRILLAYPGIDVVGASSGFARALKEIEALQPDTVIIEETEQNKSEATAEVTHLLEASPWCHRIVRMSMQDNELWVYYRQQWTINNKEELLQIISSQE
jgi:DNA-binding NarL/FixJ family response regulator